VPARLKAIRHPSPPLGTAALKARRPARHAPRVAGRTGGFSLLPSPQI